MAQDDGSVHDVPRGQYHRVSHECVHQRVCYNKATLKMNLTEKLQLTTFMLLCRIESFTRSVTSSFSCTVKAIVP